MDTPYNASPAAITWRQSRIEPSRVAPRRLTGLRTTVARFRLPASAGMPTARPPTGGPRPAVGAGRRWTRTARQGARSPVPPCQSARARRPAIIRTAFRAIVCRRVPGPAARPVRRPTARDLICGGSVAREAPRFNTCRRGTLTHGVPSGRVRPYAVHGSRLRTFANPNPTLRVQSGTWVVAVGGGAQGAGVSVTGRRRRCGFRHPRPAVRAVRANRGSARFGVVLAVAPRGPHTGHLGTLWCCS